MNIKVIGGLAARAFLTKPMLLWGLRLWSKHTANKIDDHVVEIVAAALEGDPKRMAEAAQRGVEVWLAVPPQVTTRGGGAGTGAWPPKG